MSLMDGPAQLKWGIQCQENLDPSAGLFSSFMQESFLKFSRQFLNVNS
jgi:hypothetical protein